MAVPKKRTTKSKRDKRRLHIFLKKPVLARCPKCGKLLLPHNLCSYCGYYKGREIVNILGKMTKKERKKREKEMKEKDKETQKKKPLDWKQLSKK